MTKRSSEIRNRPRLMPAAVILLQSHANTMRLLRTFRQRLHNPACARAYGGRAICYGECGKFEQALADFRTASELNPKLSYLPAQRGRIYLQKGDFEKALSDLNKALEANPKDSAAYVWRAYALWKQAERDAALLEMSVRQSSQNSHNDIATAGALGNQVTSTSRASSLGGSPTSPLDPRFLRVAAGPDQAAACAVDGSINANNEGYIRKRLHEIDEKTSKALADFSEAMRLDPKFVEAYRGRGDFCAMTGKSDLAISDLTTAIRLDDRNATLYLDRSKIYEVEGELGKAAADLDTAIRLDPKSANAYTARGDLYSKKHDISKAAADYAEAERLKPSDDRYR